MLLKDDDAQNLAEWIGEKNLQTEGSTTQEFDQFLAMILSTLPLLRTCYT